MDQVKADDQSNLTKRGTVKKTRAKKLSAPQVMEIRLLASEPCTTCGAMPTLRSLAEKFGVSAVSILQVVERRSWRHVEPELPAPSDEREQQRLRDAAALLKRGGVEFSTEAMLKLAADIVDVVRTQDGKPTAAAAA